MSTVMTLYRQNELFRDAFYPFPERNELFHHFLHTRTKIQNFRVMYYMDFPYIMYKKKFHGTVLCFFFKILKFIGKKIGKLHDFTEKKYFMNYFWCPSC